MTSAGRPIKVPLQLSEPEALGELTRQVFFSPATTHNRYQKFAVVKGAPGARGAVHTHPGEEVFTPSPVAASSRSTASTTCSSRGRPS